MNFLSILSCFKAKPRFSEGSGTHSVSYEQCDSRVQPDTIGETSAHDERPLVLSREEYIENSIQKIKDLFLADQGTVFEK